MHSRNRISRRHAALALGALAPAAWPQAGWPMHTVMASVPRSAGCMIAQANPDGTTLPMASGSILTVARRMPAVGS